MIKEKYQDTNATFKYRTVKPEDIVASGGTDAWAENVGYSYQGIVNGLKDTPSSEMTDEEWAAALEYLQKDK
jgi:hypothetical protein